MIRNKIVNIVKKINDTTNFFLNSSRNLFISAFTNRNVTDRKEMLRSLPTLDEGTVGEKAVDIDSSSYRKRGDTFPSIDTPNKLFKGIPYKDLPIFNIKVSPNNTIITLTDFKGNVSLIRSCGIEGFKNTRKGTNIAAQATAVTIGSQALENGVTTVRVRVRGLGPGRMAALKGLQLSGLEIVSITDNTKVSWNPPRPRKQRKL